MEHNRDGDSIGENYGNSNFVDNKWQKSSSQSNQYNRITLSDIQIADFSLRSNPNTFNQ